MAGLGLVPGSLTSGYQPPEIAAAFRAYAGATGKPDTLNLTPSDTSAPPPAPPPPDNAPPPDAPLITAPPDPSQPLPPAPVDPNAAPAAPTMPTPPAQESFYDFENNPIGSIGRAMAQFAAGYRGEPEKGPLAAFQKQQLEQQAMAYKKAEFAMNAIGKFAEFADKYPDSIDVIGKDWTKNFAATGINFSSIGDAVKSGELKQLPAMIARMNAAHLDPKLMATIFKDDGNIDIKQARVVDGISIAALKAQSERASPSDAAAVTTAQTEARLKAEGVKAPTQRTRISGNETIAEEFDPALDNGKGGWKEVSRGPRTGAPSTTVNIAGGNKFAEAVAAGAVKRLDESHAAAAAGTGMIKTGKQIIDALDSGKVIAGPGTKYITWASRLFGANQDALNRTRQVVQGLAKYTLENRRKLEGQGQISDTENAMVQKAAAGEIDDLSVGEIRTLVRLNNLAGVIDIKAHGDMLGRAQKAQPESAPYLDMYRVDLPAGVEDQGAPPDGIDPKTWAHMPEAQKKLWQK